MLLNFSFKVSFIRALDNLQPWLFRQAKLQMQKPENPNLMFGYAQIRQNHRILGSVGPWLELTALHGAMWINH